MLRALWNIFNAFAEPREELLGAAADQAAHTSSSSAPLANGARPLPGLMQRGVAWLLLMKLFRSYGRWKNLLVAIVLLYSTLIVFHS